MLPPADLCLFPASASVDFGFSVSQPVRLLSSLFLCFLSPGSGCRNGLMEISWRQSHPVQGHSASSSDGLAMRGLAGCSEHGQHIDSTTNLDLVFGHNIQQERNWRAGDIQRRRGRLKCSPSRRAGRRHHSPPQHPSNLALGLILKEPSAQLGVTPSRPPPAAAGMAMVMGVQA